MDQFVKLSNFQIFVFRFPVVLIVLLPPQLPVVKTAAATWLPAASRSLAIITATTGRTANTTATTQQGLPTATLTRKRWPTARHRQEAAPAAVLWLYAVGPAAGGRSARLAALMLTAWPVQTAPGPTVAVSAWWGSAGRCTPAGREQTAPQDRKAPRLWPWAAVAACRPTRMRSNS